MKVTCAIMMLVGVTVALARPDGATGKGYGPPPPAYHHAPIEYNEEPKPYAFDYGVKDDYSGANFGHSEDSDGKVVKGSYSVALPDGRIQTVTYVADDYNGYQAEVTYQGEAHYPEYKPVPYVPAPGPYAPKPYA